MPILVTGATGLVGNNLVRLLLDEGHEVRALVRPQNPARALEGLDVEVVRGDVCDAASVRAACRGADQVFHAAARVEIGWTNHEALRAANVDGTRHVASAAMEEAIPMVHVSSVDTMAAGQYDAPADEDTPDHGKIPCPYVLTKRSAERCVLEQVEQGLQAVIVNPGFMFGPWDWKPSSGRMLLEVATRFTPFSPAGGCSVCDARDVAAGILAAGRRGTVGRRYILAGYNLTYVEIWRQIARTAGGRGPLCRAGPLMRVIAGRAGDLVGRVTGREPVVNSAAVKMGDLYHFYSSARAETELGYRNRPLEETLEDAWQWFRQFGYVR